MRVVTLLSLLIPGLAQAGFVTFESSQTFAAASVSGCYVVRWGVDDGAVSEYGCGADADSGVESAGAGAPIIDYSSGSFSAFGIGVWHQSTILTDEYFDITARNYFGGNWFEGNFQGSFGWTGVFSLDDDAVLSTYGFDGGSMSVGSNSLMVRSIPSGEILYSGFELNTELHLSGNTKYAVTWLTSESGYGVVTGGTASAGVAPWANLNITRVPEPGVLSLFAAAILGFCARSMARRQVSRAAFAS